MYTIGGKDDDGHLFYFVLSLMKGAADMSSATAGCELQIFLEKSLDICNINRKLLFRITTLHNARQHNYFIHKLIT